MINRVILAQTNRPVDTVRYWRESGDMELNPPYQRGLVWGKIRKRNLIYSILRGIPIPSIIINDRASAGWDEKISCAVVDGKQRISAILDFLDGKLFIPGEWFDMEGEIAFADIPLPRQRGFRLTPIQFCEGRLKSIEEEIEVFELINFGGVAQGDKDED